MTVTKCEVCGKNDSIGVCCVPGIPISCAYCEECLKVNAHPWWILVANTSCIGGLKNAADWWKKMVEDTCKHLGKTIDEFNSEVEEAIRKFEKDFGDEEEEN